MKVTKWSIFSGDLTMSEQATGPTSGEQGSLDLGISHADTPDATAVASADGTSAGIDAPASEPVTSEASVSEASLTDPVATATPNAEVVKDEAKPVEASAPASQPQAAGETVSHVPGKVIVMSRHGRAWTDGGVHRDSEPEPEEQASVIGKRRIAAIAAVLVLAAAAGAVGGALATASLMHGGGDVAAAGNQSSALQASLARIDSDIQALKTGLDHTSRLGMSQFSKATERLDKLERAQAEPAAKLAKLSEAIDKPHALPVPPPAVAAAASATSSASKDVTGSIPAAPAQQQVAAASRNDGKTDLKADVKGEVGRLPTLDDWVLRDVAYGGALIDGRRRGVYEVYAGDMVPGLGRVDAIRRQDGRWVVVTSRGLIVAR
jgi:hypothetical protein